MERWLQGFLVPMGAFLVTMILIVGIGELLLAMPRSDVAHLGGTPVLVSVVVALTLALVVLVGAAVLASGGDRSHE